MLSELGGPAKCTKLKKQLTGDVTETHTHEINSGCHVFS